MIACVHGFPTKIAALQFEWQWTYPKKSRRLKTLMSSGRRWTTGTKGKIELLYALVSSNPWSHLPLHIRFTSQSNHDDYHNVVMKRSARELAALERAMVLKSDEKKAEKMLAHHIYQLPAHIDVSAGPLTELAMYVWLESRRKRGVKAIVNVDSISNVVAVDDPLTDDIFDDDNPVSGEESHDSDEADDVEPGWDDVSEMHDHGSSDILDDEQSLSESSESRERCTVCLNQKPLNSRSRMFVTECPQCHVSMHVVCAASHILSNIPNDPSSAARVHPISSSLPLSPFATLPNSLPLIPPLATGACPSCRASWNWPVLMERCRSIFVDSKGRRGGDTFFRAAGASSAMTQLMKEFAGRQPSESPAADPKKKSTKTRKRKADSADSSSVQSESPITEHFGSASQRVTSQSAHRRIEMVDGYPSLSAAVVDQSNPISPQSLKRSLLANAATKRLAARSPRAATMEIIDSSPEPGRRSRSSPARRSLSMDELQRKKIVNIVEDEPSDDILDIEHSQMLSLRERLARRKKKANS